MSNVEPDEQEEKPLDPVMENVRRKMVRLQLVSAGIMGVMLMAVLAAIVYKVTQRAPETPVASSGFSVPSKANEEAFERAVDEVAATAARLIESMVTTAEPKDRAVEAERAKARSAARFGAVPG